MRKGFAPSKPKRVRKQAEETTGNNVLVLEKPRPIKSIIQLAGSQGSWKSNCPPALADGQWKQSNEKLTLNRSTVVDGHIDTDTLEKTQLTPRRLGGVNCFGIAAVLGSRRAGYRSACWLSLVGRELQR